MRPFRRSLLWLMPVILAPLVALLVMQYSFLRNLETTTVSAERNWLRTTVDDVTRAIDTYYRNASDAALCVTPAILESPSRFADHVRSTGIGGAKLFFAMRFHGEEKDITYVDSAGACRMPTRSEDEAVKLATVSWHVVHKHNSVVSMAGLSTDDRDPNSRVVMKPVLDDGLHVIGMVGAVFSPAAVEQKMLALAAPVVRLRYPNDNDVTVRVGDPSRFRFATGNHEFVTQGLGFAFMDWRAGVRDNCASPEEIAAANFRINAILTAVVSVLLLAAIALAAHATSRQMRLSQMKSDFVSNVSHELRTPLSSIRVFGEYMRLGRVTNDAKIREYGEYIEGEGRRLTSLINNILDFSKIESADKKYHFADCDVARLVCQTVTAFEMPLRQDGVTIALTVQDQPLPQVSLDRDAMGQALVNLLDNAVKYSGERKEIAVDIASSGSEVRITIRDRGIGIAPREQKKIFDKFYRVGSGLVHDVKGSGLGLAIVAHIVKAHRGRVEVASTPGEGSTFTIILPAAETQSVTIPTTTELA